jgi:hypothetical protein
VSIAKVCTTSVTSTIITVVVMIKGQINEAGRLLRASLIDRGILPIFVIRMRELLQGEKEH